MRFLTDMESLDIVEQCHKETADTPYLREAMIVHSIIKAQDARPSGQWGNGWKRMAGMRHSRRIA